MAPGSGSAERVYHHQQNGSNGSKASSRTPGTPRKEARSSSNARERALQDPGLKDYVRRLPSCPSART